MTKYFFTATGAMDAGAALSLTEGSVEYSGTAANYVGGTNPSGSVDSDVYTKTGVDEYQLGATAAQRSFSVQTAKNTYTDTFGCPSKSGLNPSTTVIKVVERRTCLSSTVTATFLSPAIGESGITSSTWTFSRTLAYTESFDVSWDAYMNEYLNTSSTYIDGIVFGVDNSINVCIDSAIPETFEIGTYVPPNNKVWVTPHTWLEP